MKIFFGFSCARDISFLKNFSPLLKKIFSPQKNAADIRRQICGSIFTPKTQISSARSSAYINSSAPVRTVKTYSFTEAALSAERAKTSVAAAETQAKYTGESMVAGTRIAAKMHAPFTIGERIFIVLSLFTAFFDNE